jgi:hypothetical protein
MTSRHSAGQWTNRTIGDPTDIKGTQIYAGKKHIATAHYSGNPNVELEEARANAKLIAATPDLLAALNDILLRHPEDEGWDGELWVNARAALTKAKGIAAPVAAA